MEYTLLKGTGLKVSRFCLGTMTFGGQTNEEDSIRIVHHALDEGVNFFDTAGTYTGGISEKYLGKALEGRREEAVIATKVNNPRGPLPNQSGQGRKHIMTDIEESLRSLRTDYIDLYYLHHPDYSTPMEEIIETMTNLVRSGKIRYYGLSNHSAWKCCQFIDKAREMHAVAPVVTESVYNLITRGLDDEMLPFLEEYNMGLAVYNPIAAGLLTGKHSKQAPAEGSRFAINSGYAQRYFNDQNLDAVEEIKRIASDEGMGILEFSLQWLLNQKAVDSIIVGTSKYEHAVENIALASETKKISPEALERCDELWNSIRGHYFSYFGNAHPPKRAPGEKKMF